MITANQINADSTIDDLASFLKFSTAAQFHPLNQEQVEILEDALDDAYANHVHN